VRNSSDRIEFGAHSAPLDFDGGRMLWLEFHEENMETLMIYKFTEPEQPYVIVQYNDYPSHVSFAKLWFNQVIVVQGNRHIRVYDIATGKLVRNVGSHTSEIVAFNVTTKTIAQTSICAVVSVDYNGTI
jgi:hypothetical protein